MRKGIKLGLDEIYNIKLGSSQISAVALGDQLVWQWDVDSVDYSYNSNTKQLTVTINPTLKTLKRLQEGRLFLQLDYKDLQARRNWIIKRTDHQHLRCRGESRKYNVSGRTIPLTQLTTTVDLSDITIPFSYQSNRQIEAQRKDDITFVYIVPWIKFLPLNASTSNITNHRHLPGSTGASFRLNLVNDDYTYSYVEYDYTSWEQTSAHSQYIRFIAPGEYFPIGTVGIGIEGDNLYVRYNDEYGNSKTANESDCVWYWIEASTSFSTANLHDFDTTPIPSATRFHLVAHFPSAHTADIISVTAQMNVTTKTNA